MSTPEPFKPHRTPRPSEQGNIALVTALLVMALAGVGIGMARFVQMQADSSTEMRLSNFSGTLAQNVAESAVNQILFNWSSGSSGAAGPTATVTVPGNGVTGTLTAFPAVTTNYGNFSVSSSSTYSVTVADAGANWLITAVGTVTANGAVLPSLSWRTVTRTVQATVEKGTYKILGLVRS